MCLGGDWDVQARYMRATCVVHAWYKLVQSQESWRASLLVPVCFRRDLGSSTTSPAGAISPSHVRGLRFIRVWRFSWLRSGVCERRVCSLSVQEA